jgi:DNA repair protein RadC
LVLTLAIPRRDVKPTAKNLIRRFKSLRGIMDAPIEELEQVEGWAMWPPRLLRLSEFLGVLFARGLRSEVVLNNYPKLENFWRMRMGGSITRSSKWRIWTRRIADEGRVGTVGGEMWMKPL